MAAPSPWSPIWAESFDVLSPFGSCWIMALGTLTPSLDSSRQNFWAILQPPCQVLLKAVPLCWLQAGAGLLHSLWSSAWLPLHSCQLETRAAALPAKRQPAEALFRADRSKTLWKLNLPISSEPGIPSQRSYQMFPEALSKRRLEAWKELPFLLPNSAGSFKPQTLMDR